MAGDRRTRRRWRGRSQQRLSDRTLATERDLVRNMERVIRVMARLSEPQRAAIQRCVELMCYGMPRFQFNASLKGLATLERSR